ncbi:hypothetical protein EGW08_010597 [Elysia chlorotica]|uniref:Mutator-like transposase domain-containing protein n=1 Tax=Elysia chlorotica TaxID=188477 RepID=A0A3S1BDR3_ELYCH|nr:hypothetical protein EGW08_010597 [Elysia chlorotica]
MMFRCDFADVLINGFCSRKIPGRRAIRLQAIPEGTIRHHVITKINGRKKAFFSKAASIVRAEHIKHYHLNDGSWLTRGHKSLIGIGCVIDVLTGLIIDGHVCSLHCHICAQTGAFIRRETPHHYERWRQEHIATGECTINFEGSPGMMEVKAAEVLWCRSVEDHKLRYTTMVSDGDSKAHTNLLKVQPYGLDETIDKEDCINHVGKRLGAALRNLVSDCSKKRITLGGRGRGRLTAEVIRKLQIYYSRAIRGSETAKDMRRKVLATIYHGYSTDDLPQHQFCPPGPNSWCFYKRAIGEHQYPTGHDKKVHTPLDQKLLQKYIEPIHKRLASLELLKKCELKTTSSERDYIKAPSRNSRSLKRGKKITLRTRPSPEEHIHKEIASLQRHNSRCQTAAEAKRIKERAIASANKIRKKKALEKPMTSATTFTERNTP